MLHSPDAHVGWLCTSPLMGEHCNADVTTHGARLQLRDIVEGYDTNW